MTPRRLPRDPFPRYDFKFLGICAVVILFVAGMVKGIMSLF